MSEAIILKITGSNPVRAANSSSNIQEIADRPALQNALKYFGIFRAFRSQLNAAHPAESTQLVLTFHL